MSVSVNIWLWSWEIFKHQHDWVKLSSLFLIIFDFTHFSYLLEPVIDGKEWCHVGDFKVCIIQLDHICFEKSSLTFWQVQGLAHLTRYAYLSKAIPLYPPTSWQESGMLFQDSNMHLHWGLPNHLPRNGQEISPDDQ